MQEFNNKCRICGFFITQRHHIMPKGHGGPDIFYHAFHLCPNHHRLLYIILDSVKYLSLRKNPASWTLVNSDMGFKRFVFDEYIPELERQIKMTGKYMGSQPQLENLLKNLKGGKND